MYQPVTETLYFRRDSHESGCSQWWEVERCCDSDFCRCTCRNRLLLAEPHRCSQPDILKPDMDCIFDHNASSVVIYELSKGCVCFDAHLQPRCPQHAYDLESNVSYTGTCKIIHQYDPATPWPWKRGATSNA